MKSFNFTNNEMGDSKINKLDIPIGIYSRLIVGHDDKIYIIGGNYEADDRICVG